MKSHNPAVVFILIACASARQQPLFHLSRALQHNSSFRPAKQELNRDSYRRIDVSAQGRFQSKSVEEDFPVDVVYTWAAEPRNGSDAWAEIERSCGSVEIQRYRNYGTLCVSLLSVHLFMPWVRKVFIVTAGEIPCGISNFFVPIEIVTHEQIYPQERQGTDLPTHNSLALETHLHRIPGLAEHFIYFNDDMFVGKPLEKSFFFTASGKAVYYNMTVIGNNYAMPQIENASCTATKQGEAKHQANPFRKSAIVMQQQQAPEFYARLSGQRCRDANMSADDPPFWNYMCFHVRYGYANLVELKHTLTQPWLNPTVALLSHQNVEQASLWYGKVLLLRPSKFCINDDFDNITGTRLQSQKRNLAAFLRNYFEIFPPARKILKACLSCHTGA